VKYSENEDGLLLIHQVSKILFSSSYVLCSTANRKNPRAILGQPVLSWQNAGVNFIAQDGVAVRDLAFFQTKLLSNYLLY